VRDRPADSRKKRKKKEARRFASLPEATSCSSFSFWSEVACDTAIRLWALVQVPNMVIDSNESGATAMDNCERAFGLIRASWATRNSPCHADDPYGTPRGGTTRRGEVRDPADSRKKEEEKKQGVSPPCQRRRPTLSFLFGLKSLATRPSGPGYLPKYLMWLSSHHKPPTCWPGALSFQAWLTVRYSVLKLMALLQLRKASEVLSFHEAQGHPWSCRANRFEPMGIISQLPGVLPPRVGRVGFGRPQACLVGCNKAAPPGATRVGHRRPRIFGRRWPTSDERGAGRSE
jgi:hypothetical protein